MTGCYPYSLGKMTGTISEIRPRLCLSCRQRPPVIDIDHEEDFKVYGREIRTYSCHWCYTKKAHTMLRGDMETILMNGDEVLVEELF